MIVMTVLINQTSVFVVKENNVTDQINLGLINKLLSIPKEQWPKKSRKTNHPGISEHIEEMVEKERQRRFEMIMDIPPFTFTDLIRRKALPWM